MSENRDPSAVACSFQHLRSVGSGSPQQHVCGDAGRSAAAPAPPLSAPPRRVTSGRCCLSFQSPAPREQHPTGRRAAHAGSLRTGKKGRHKAGHAHRMLLQTMEAFHRAEQTWSRQSCSPGQPFPGRPGWDALCPGGDPGVVQSLSASCCPAAGSAPS